MGHCGEALCVGQQHAIPSEQHQIQLVRVRVHT